MSNHAFFLSSLRILCSFLLVFLFNFANISYAKDIPNAKILTFREFYGKVLAYYPKLKKQDSSVNLAIARKYKAASGFMPQFTAGASFEIGNDPVYVFGSLLRENAFNQENFSLSNLNKPDSHPTFDFSIGGKLPVFDALQTIYRVKAAKLHVESARFESLFTKMEAYLVASDAYLKAIAVEKLLVTCNEISLASLEDVKAAKDLKDKGLILGADFYVAKVAFGNINQLKNKLEQDKMITHVLLNIIMGEEPFNTFEIEGNIRPVKMGESLDNLFDIAYKSRPDLAAIEKIIKAQRIDLSREKSTILPRINAFAEVHEDTHRLSANGGQNYLAGVKAQIDIFDPAYLSRIKISKEELKKLEFDEKILKDSIAGDIAGEFGHFKTTESNIPVIKEMLNDAKEGMDLMLPLYREGRKSIADLLEVRYSYLSVAKAYYSLITDVEASRTRLFFLSGQLGEFEMEDLAKRITNE